MISGHPALTIRSCLAPKVVCPKTHRPPPPGCPPSAASHCNICSRFQYHRIHHRRRLRIQSHSYSKMSAQRWEVMWRWCALLVGRVLHEVVVGHVGQARVSICERRRCMRRKKTGTGGKEWERVRETGVAGCWRSSEWELRASAFDGSQLAPPSNPSSAGEISVMESIESKKIVLAGF